MYAECFCIFSFHFIWFNLLFWLSYFYSIKRIYRLFLHLNILNLILFRLLFIFFFFSLVAHAQLSLFTFPHRWPDIFFFYTRDEKRKFAISQRIDFLYSIFIQKQSQYKMKNEEVEVEDEMLWQQNMCLR